jgi:hypothetical protein
VKSEWRFRAVGVSTGDSVMMGQQTGDQSQLFYLFNLEKRIPTHHLLRRINPIVTRVLADLREKRKSFYIKVQALNAELPVGYDCARRATATTVDVD